MTSLLPCVDEHSRRVDATPERAWSALLELVKGRLTRPAPAAFVALWQLEPRAGFEIAEQIAPSRLTLQGRHRFSRYQLSFEVTPAKDGAQVSARTLADFPGLAGKAYRALVIGSGGHRLAVRQMLAQIARVAERAA